MHDIFFLLGITVVPSEIKDNVWAKSCGQDVGRRRIMGDVQIAISNSGSKISLLPYHSGEKKIIILLIKVDLFWKNIARPMHLDSGESGEWAVTSRFLNAKNMPKERKCLSHYSFF